MKKAITIISIFLLVFGALSSFAQTMVSITIDDIPNTKKYEQDHFKSLFLNELDSMAIPIAIFINEGLLYKTDAIPKNVSLLNDWVKSENTTLGNHTFSHSRYSEVGINSFKLDIEKGEYITRELANKYHKPLHYFRFPYNDLGMDSTQHNQIDSLLHSKNYYITPFTIESSDWMFNYVYEYYLRKSDFDSASIIGNLYVAKTLDYFQFFDSLSIQKFGRKINQIYLCHDNALNTDYLPKIIFLLKKKNYTFVTLDNALEDVAYHQEFAYYRKWGVSWFYRWMPTQKERVKWMKTEPNIDAIYDLYDDLVSKQNH